MVDLDVKEDVCGWGQGGLMSCLCLKMLMVMSYWCCSVWQCRGAYDLDDDLLPAKPSVDSDLCVPDCPTKYDVDMSSDDEDIQDIPLDLAALKPTSENFAAVVAECSRLRTDKRRCVVPQ